MGKSRGIVAKFSACANDDQLWNWVAQHLNLKIPRNAVCPGHQAPFDYLRTAYFEPAKDLVVWAPRGGGKTRLGAAATLLDLLHKPGCAVRILGGSLEQSLKMWDHLFPDVQRLAKRMLAGKPRAGRIKLKSGASAGVLTQSQRAVRGMRIQKLRCDEVELFDPKIWDAAMLTTQSIKCDRDKSAAGWELIRGTVEAVSTLHEPAGLMSQIIESAMTTNTATLKWCLFEVLEKCPKDRDCDTCPLLEECGRRAKKECDGFLRIDDAIAMKRRVSRETWESEMLCLRPVTKHCVFPTFEPITHVSESAPKNADPAAASQWLAIDFGFVNPFVCLWISVWDDGSVHVIDEYVQTQRTTDEHIAEILRRPWRKPAEVACDPAGVALNEQTGRSNVNLLTAAGFKVRSRGSKITEGLELIRAGLRSGTRASSLRIHPRCKRLIEAMGGYRYAGNGNETPLKDGRHDHLIDALRYFHVNQRGNGKATTSTY